MTLYAFKNSYDEHKKAAMGPATSFLLDARLGRKNYQRNFYHRMLRKCWRKGRVMNRLSRINLKEKRARQWLKLEQVIKVFNNSKMFFFSLLFLFNSVI